MFTILRTIDTRMQAAEREQNAGTLPAGCAQSLNEIARFFSELELKEINEKRLEDLRNTADPPIRLVIAITPRSGSSYLCDLLTSSNCFGIPQEYIHEALFDEFIELMPARSADEYLSHLFRQTATPNGVATLKTDWFRLKDFMALLPDRARFYEFKYIFLTRDDRAAQAVSLYRAVESKIWHTSENHTKAEVRRLEQLDYSFEKINRWHENIVEQELGWRQYFEEMRLPALPVKYEELESNPSAVLNKIATYIGVDPSAMDVSTKPSPFRKLRDDKSIDWADRFRAELDALQAGEATF